MSPDTDLTRDSLKSGDKYKLGNIQTYRLVNYDLRIELEIATFRL